MTEQEEFEFRQRLEQEQSAPRASVEVRGANEADLFNTLDSTIGGIIGGQIAGPVINKGMQHMRSSAPSAASAPGASNGAAPGQKYAAKTGYGSGTGYTVQEVVEHQKAQSKPIGSGKISGKIPGNSPMNVDKMLQLEAAKKAEDARRAAALAPTGVMAKMPAPVQAAGRFLGGATQAAVSPYLGRAVAGASTGFQGADAINRFRQDDNLGGAISTIGAIGSGLSFFPTPITRYGGIALGAGAAALNAYLDKLKGEAETAFTPLQQQPAPQGGLPPQGGVPPPQQPPMQQSPLNSMVPPMAEGGSVFNPAGSGYDYKTAFAHGMGPTGTGENKGHFGSVAPTSDDEQMLHGIPRDSYVMLKGKAHETFDKAEKAEKERGSKVVKSGNRYYSVPQ